MVRVEISKMVYNEEHLVTLPKKTKKKHNKNKQLRCQENTDLYTSL
jgi:hypothetical protein